VNAAIILLSIILFAIVVPTSMALGSMDIFREPIVLLLIATFAPILRDAIANTLRALGKAGEDEAAKTPDKNDDVAAHTRKLFLDGIADAIKSGETDKAAELAKAIGIDLSGGGESSGVSAPSGAPTPAPGARNGG
jgi:hypothetical protein